MGPVEFLSPGMVLRLTTTPTISKIREAWSPLSFVPSSPTDAGAIHIDEMRIRAAKRDAQSALLELVSHRLGILECLRLQSLELFGLRQFESQRQAGENIDMRSALFAREDGLVDLLCDGRVGGQQHRAARTVN